MALTETFQILMVLESLNFKRHSKTLSYGPRSSSGRSKFASFRSRKRYLKQLTILLSVIGQVTS